MTDAIDFMELAVEEARKGGDEGGIPIGSVLVVDDQVVGAGHNRRVQKGSSILHAEMDAIENAGRLPASVYRRATLYSTLSPCDMCSGTALLYGIPRIVIGENQTFTGPEEYMRSRGSRIGGAATARLQGADGRIHRGQPRALERRHRGVRRRSTLRPIISGWIEDQLGATEQRNGLAAF